MRLLQRMGQCDAVRCCWQPLLNLPEDERLLGGMTAMAPQRIAGDSSVHSCARIANCRKFLQFVVGAADSQ